MRGVRFRPALVRQSYYSRPFALGLIPYSGLLYHTPEKERLTDTSEFPCKNWKGAFINPSTPVENLGGRLFTSLVFVHVRTLGRQDSPYVRCSNTRKSAAALWKSEPRLRLGVLVEKVVESGVNLSRSVVSHL